MLQKINSYLIEMQFLPAERPRFPQNFNIFRFLTVTCLAD